MEAIYNNSDQELEDKADGDRRGVKQQRTESVKSQQRAKTVRITKIFSTSYSVC